MKKHHILLTVKIPADAADYDKWKKWKLFQPFAANKAKQNEEIVVLAENTWLIPRDSGLPFAAECIALARSYNLEHNSWFLDEG